MTPFDAHADAVVDLAFTHAWRRSGDGVTWLFLLAEEAGRPAGLLTAAVWQGQARIDPPTVADPAREAELGDLLLARARRLLIERGCRVPPALPG
jgi:hypothetical protein